MLRVWVCRVQGFRLWGLRAQLFRVLDSGFGFQGFE